MPSPSSPRQIRWGILATGGIAQTFARDLTAPPSTRGITDLTHTVIAAASSSSVDRARTFLRDVSASPSAKAYGSYADLAADPDVDIIYIATPHSHHYQNVYLCLSHAKPVLCEKAFTVNAAQARALIALAKEKGVFLMEAVWTRFFPLSTYIRSLITSGKLGVVSRVYADTSMAQDPDVAFADGTHRLVNPKLAGGALLDLGVYSLTWVFQTLYTTLPLEKRGKPSVEAAVRKLGTGVDGQTSVLLTFPASPGSDDPSTPAHGIATSSFYVATDSDGKGSAGPAIRIQGTKGEVVVYGPAYRPTRTKLVLHDGTVEEKEWKQPGPGKGSGWYNGFGGTMNEEGEGHGMFWEADEAARGVLEGRGESGVFGLEESVAVMEVMDEVRRKGGVEFPEEIESLEYPLNLG